MAPDPIGVQPAICVNPGHNATTKESGPSFSHRMSLQPERSWMDASFSSEPASYKLGGSGEASISKVSALYELVGSIVCGSIGKVGKEIYNDIVRHVSLYAFP